MGWENSKHIFISPNGEMLACVKQKDLLIKDVYSNHIRTVFSCDGEIENVTWSSDSQLLLCAVYKESIVHVFSVLESYWNMKINEGAGGLVAACFSPDNTYVLTALYYGLNICIYSLNDKSTYMLPGAKLLSDYLPGIAFSPDSELLAIVERQPEQISIYSCKSWNRLKCFQYSDVEGMSWSPDSVVLAVWGGRSEYNLHIFLIDGHCVFSESSEDSGVENVVWSSCGNMLAISRWETKDLKLMNCLTWKMIAYLEPSRALLDAGLTKIVQEANSSAAPLDQEAPSLSLVGNICTYNKFPGPDRKLIKFSLCGQYLSVIDGSAVWLWDCGQLISLIEVTHPVINTAWDELGRLAIWIKGKELIWWNSKNFRLFRQLLQF